MNKLLVFLAAFFFSIAGMAQISGGKYDKLFDEVLMEDYEGCLKRALKMTEKDEYRKEPEPYLYVAYCYLALSENPDMEELYPNAFKDAMKFAAKGVKYDAKDRNTKSDDRTEHDDAGYYVENNQDFLNRLKRAGMDEAEFYFNEDNFSKAASTYSRVQKIDPEDENILMITAACQFKSRNVGQGKMTLQESLDLIKKKYSIEGYKPNETTLPALEDGIIAYTDYLIESGDKEGAKAFMEEIIQYLDWNDKIDAQYQRVVN